MHSMCCGCLSHFRLSVVKNLSVSVVHLQITLSVIWTIKSVAVPHRTLRQLVFGNMRSTLTELQFVSRYVLILF